MIETQERREEDLRADGDHRRREDREPHLAQARRSRSPAHLPMTTPNSASPTSE